MRGALGGGNATLHIVNDTTQTPVCRIEVDREPFPAKGRARHE